MPVKTAKNASNRFNQKVAERMERQINRRMEMVKEIGGIVERMLTQFSSDQLEAIRILTEFESTVLTSESENAALHFVELTNKRIDSIDRTTSMMCALADTALQRFVGLERMRIKNDRFELLTKSDNEDYDETFFDDEDEDSLDESFEKAVNSYKAV